MQVTGCRLLVAGLLLNLIAIGSSEGGLEEVGTGFLFSDLVSCLRSSGFQLRASCRNFL